MVAAVLLCGAELQFCEPVSRPALPEVIDYSEHGNRWPLDEAMRDLEIPLDAGSGDPAADLEICPTQQHSRSQWKSRLVEILESR